MAALLAEWGISYGGLRQLHITAALLSGALLMLRGLGVQAGAVWPMHGALRYTTYTIDSVLLLAALMLFALLPAEVFSNGWLLVKLLLVVLYILCGSLALKRAPNRRLKGVALVAALALFGCIYAVARSHSPWGGLS